MKIENATPYKEQIIELLAAQKLPVEDLPDRLENFVVAFDGDELAGVAGIEIYGRYGLLRSVAVNPAYRNKGIAAGLLAEIERIAAQKGLHEIILLTETAPDYFAKKGFQQISRSEIAPEVQQSSEFSHVCPQSAIAMKREIPFNNIK